MTTARARATKPNYERLAEHVRMAAGRGVVVDYVGIVAEAFRVVGEMIEAGECPREVMAALDAMDAVFKQPDASPRERWQTVARLVEALFASEAEIPL